MSQPVSKGRGEKPPRRSLLPLLAAAVVFLLLIAGATFWQIRALMNKPKAAVALATEPSLHPQLTDASGPKLGGVIRNEQGEPVANARVSFNYEVHGAQKEAAFRSMMAQRPANLPAPNYDTFHAFKSAPATTDSAGRFSTTRVPNDNLDGLRLTAIQAEYVPLIALNPPTPQLLDQSAVFVMSRGVDAAGIVVDDHGKPIAGAQLSERQTYSGPPPPIMVGPRVSNFTTNSEGRFAIRHLAPGSQFELSVSMPGFGPTGQHITLPLPEDLRIVLSPSREITGRVTDAAGVPVSGATVRMEIPNAGANPPPGVTTNAQGEFHLHDAPQDSVSIYASKQGYYNDFQTAAPDQPVPLLTLRKEIVFTGGVNDAVTHLPVAQFKVYSGGTSHPNIDPLFMNPLPFTGGKYKMVIMGPSSDTQAYYVKIEAKGYETAISDPQTDSATANFQLQPTSKSIAGHVLTAAGKPAAGASVFLAGPTPPLVLDDGQVTMGRETEIRADAAGGFEFPPQTDLFLIAAMTDDGYARADGAQFAANPDLHLAPWAKIEGRALIGDKPAAGARIHLLLNSILEPGHGARYPRVEQRATAIAGDDGGFTFTRLTPGVFTISRQVSMPDFKNDKTPRDVFTANVVVSAGETQSVTLGAGRPVIGHVNISDDLKSRHDWYAYASAKIIAQPVPIPYPAQAVNANDRAKWLTDFYQTDRGRSLRQMQIRALAAQHEYWFSFGPDGDFRIEDCLPGDYEVSVSIMPTGPGNYLASTHARFTLPAPAAAQPAEALKIPDINFGPGNDITPHPPTALVRIPSTAAAADTQLNLRVLDPAGSPAPGISVYLARGGRIYNFINGGRILSLGESTVTDADGRAAFSPPDGPYAVFALAQQGFAQANPGDIANSHDLSLEAWAAVDGIFYSGAVPTPGATIDLQRVHDQMQPGDPNVFINYSAVSDAAGKYHFDRVAPGDYDLSRENRPDPHIIENAQSRRVTILPGRHTTLDIGREGRPIIGRVALPAQTAPAGKLQINVRATRQIRLTLVPMPRDVANSNAISRKKWLDDFYKTDQGKAYLADSKNARAVSTGNSSLIDSDGAFRLEDIVPGEYQLSLSETSSDGTFLGTGGGSFTMPDDALARADQPLNLGEFPLHPQGYRTPRPAPPAPATTAPAAPVQGRVLDAAGAPLSGANLGLEIHRGYPTVFVTTTLSNADGRFQVPGASLIGTVLKVSKDGYYSTEVALSPGDTEKTITLHLVPRFQGKVTDAVTKQPVGHFEISIHPQYAGSTLLGFYDSSTHTGGTYDSSPTDSSGAATGWIIRIESPGYLPAVSPVLQHSEKRDFQLQPAADFEARVLSPDGTPIMGALIAATPPWSPPNLNNGNLRVSDKYRAESGPNGRFKIAPQIDPLQILAISEVGCAQTHWQPGTPFPDITLYPWGRIDGRVLDGAQPVAAKKVQIRRVLTPDSAIDLASYYWDATTDSAGRFQIDHVPPGDYEAGRMEPSALWSSAMGTQYIPMQLTRFTVQYGQTAAAQIGGRGRPVRARILLPPSFPDLTNVGFDAHAFARPKSYTGPQFPAFADSAGNLHIDDLIPGDYTVTITAQSHVTLTKVSATSDFTVPPIPGGRSDQPLNIPDITLSVPPN